MSPPAEGGPLQSQIGSGPKPIIPGVQRPGAFDTFDMVRVGRKAVENHTTSYADSNAPEFDLKSPYKLNAELKVLNAHATQTGSWVVTDSADLAFLLAAGGDAEQVNVILAGIATTVQTFTMNDIITLKGYAGDLLCRLRLKASGATTPLTVVSFRMFWTIDMRGYTLYDDQMDL